MLGSTGETLLTLGGLFLLLGVMLVGYIRSKQREVKLDAELLQLEASIRTLIKLNKQLRELEEVQVDEKVEAEKDITGRTYFSESNRL